MAWRAIQNTVGTSESLASLSDLAERLHWRLLAHSDPWGRLDGKPRKLRALCYPMLAHITDPMAGEALLEMVAADRMLVYEIDGQVVIQVVDFEKHQPREAFRKRPPASVFPDFRNGSGMVPEALRKLFGITPDAGVSGSVPEWFRNGSGGGPEETRRDETEKRQTPPPNGGVLARAGWTRSQQQEALADEPRAFAWVRFAESQDDTRSVGARSWDGFKGGGWPEKPPGKTVRYDHVCPECSVECKTARLLEEHVHVQHPEIETAEPPAELSVMMGSPLPVEAT